MDTSFIVPQAIYHLSEQLRAVFPSESAASLVPLDGANERPYTFISQRYYPQLIDAIVGQIRTLIAGGMPPAEIVVLAPYLSDSLRFSLMHRLETAGIPVRSHRPSRSLRDEPACRCLLTLSALAHPGWGIRPSRFDFASALMIALDMDLIRAQMLAEIVYRSKDLRLSTFDEIKPDMQERITFVHGNRYKHVRAWLTEYRTGEPLSLDHFLRKLFGEVLSQPGYGFHLQADHVRVAASLIESVQKFRQAMETPGTGGGEEIDLGSEYSLMLQEGVISAQYIEGWQAREDESVLIAPAYTFLMMNRPVSIQFWLDIGSQGWIERLSQPLTHPYVLSRQWAGEARGRLWTDSEEAISQNEALNRLLTGLLYRCRGHIYLGLASLGESGYEQRGGLLRAFQQVLQAERGTR